VPASPVSPRTKIERLKMALPAARKLKPNETLTAKPMAELIGVRWPTLREWVDECPGLESAGAVLRGGQGTEYIFRPKAAINALIKHFGSQVAQAAKKARRTRQIIGAESMLDVPEDFSLDETRKLLDTAIRFQDAKVNSGELVRRNHVVAILNRTFPEMLHAGLLAAQQADPNGRWSPDQRIAAETVARMMLAAQQSIITRDMAKINGATA
jgi:hypothetical protein